MRHRSFAIICMLSLGLALGMSPARAAVTLIAAGPGSQATGSYATPLVVAQVAGTLTFLNQDVQPHGIFSAEAGPSTQSWCRFFASDHCPLLWAPVTDAGGRTTLVRGLGNTTQGSSYSLNCIVHPSMRATLITV